MTKDLALITSLKNVTVLSTGAFLDEVAGELKGS